MLNNFVTFYRNLDKKYKVIFWVALADVFIIIAIAIFYFTYRLNNEPQYINITNYNEIVDSNAPSGFRNTTESNLHQIITDYNKVPSDTFAEATIREGSYSQVDNQSTRKISFLVDIPSLEQTYDINFSYDTTSKKTEDFQVFISCPIYTDIIYNNKCVTSNDIYSNIQMYLPYSGYLPQSNKKVTIKKRFYDSFQQHANEPYLAVSINSCDDPDIIQEGNKYIQTWLKKRYLDPNDFYIEILNLCE